MRIIFLAAFAFILFLYVKHFSKNNKPFAGALKSSLCGVASFMAVNCLASFTGVSLAVNYFTVAFTALLGIPGTIAILLIKLL